MSGHILNLIGQKFGNLTVLSRVGSIGDKKKISVWLCQCACGNFVKKNRPTLLSKHKGIMSCGCISIKWWQKHTEIIGKRFGKLTVIRDSGERYRSTRQRLYECLCDCGNTVKKVRNYFSDNANAVKSCGCARPNGRTRFSNLSGRRFGLLTVTDKYVIKEDFYGGSRKHTTIHWECICDCGKRLLVSRGHLIIRGRISCGCAGKILLDGFFFASKIEAIFYLRLKNKGTKFEYQKRYGDTGSRCDFYLPESNTYVEVTSFDGTNFKQWKSYHQKIQYKKHLAENILRAKFLFLQENPSKEDMAELFKQGAKIIQKKKKSHLGQQALCGTKQKAIELWSNIDWNKSNKELSLGLGKNINTVSLNRQRYGWKKTMKSEYELSKMELQCRDVFQSEQKEWTQKQWNKQPNRPYCSEILTRYFGHNGPYPDKHWLNVLVYFGIPISERMKECCPLSVSNSN